MTQQTQIVAPTCLAADNQLPAVLPELVTAFKAVGSSQVVSLCGIVNVAKTRKNRVKSCYIISHKYGFHFFIFFGGECWRKCFTVTTMIISLYL